MRQGQAAHPAAAHGPATEQKPERPTFFEQTISDDRLIQTA
jgi:hypothetical protein